MWWLIGLGAVVAAIGLLAWRLDPDRRLRRAVAARDPLPDAELAARHFPAGDPAGQVAARVRRALAGYTGHPAERLRPDDDLAFSWAGADVAEVVAELEEVFGIRITDAEAGRTPCTIRAVALLIANKRHAEPSTAADPARDVGSGDP